MSGILSAPMPNIATSRDKAYSRIPVDSSHTSFFEGREFRAIRKISSPMVLRFTSDVEFILMFQSFTITSGEYEFHAWRDDNVTPSGTWTDLPTFNKNISTTRKLYNGDFYQSQVTLSEGGSITVIDNDLYSDFTWLKAATASGQKSSILGQSAQDRFLAAGTYYLQFTGTADGSYAIEWEERP